jgi:hypothetical protein
MKKKTMTSTTKMTKATYFMFTDSRVRDLFIENFGDRTFYSRRTHGTGFSTWSDTLVSGSPDWEITEETLTSIAHDIFNVIIERREKETAEKAEAEKPKKKRHFGTSGNRPKWTCQDCGLGIGYLGRFFEALFGKTHSCQ